MKKTKIKTPTASEGSTLFVAFYFGPDGDYRITEVSAGISLPRYEVHRKDLGWHRVATHLQKDAAATTALDLSGLGAMVEGPLRAVTAKERARCVTTRLRPPDGFRVTVGMDSCRVRVHERDGETWWACERLAGDSYTDLRYTKSREAAIQVAQLVLLGVPPQTTAEQRRLEHEQAHLLASAPKAAAAPAAPSSGKAKSQKGKKAVPRAAFVPLSPHRNDHHLTVHAQVLKTAEIGLRTKAGMVRNHDYQIAHDIVRITDNWPTYEKYAERHSAATWAYAVTGRRFAASESRRRMAALRTLGELCDEQALREGVSIDMVVYLAGPSVPEKLRKKVLAAVLQEAQRGPLTRQDVRAIVSGFLKPVKARDQRGEQLRAALAYISGLEGWVSAARKAESSLRDRPAPPARPVLLGGADGVSNGLVKHAEPLGGKPKKKGAAQ